MLIGEAANRLSLEFIERYSEVPWGQMIGMRNQLIHGYGDVDLEIVWDTLQIEIPELIKRIDRLSEDERPTSHQ